MLKALTAGAHEASGSLHHPSICHRAEVGQNYLDFSCPMGVSFSGFCVVDKGDGVLGGTQSHCTITEWPLEDNGSLDANISASTG